MFGSGGKGRERVFSFASVDSLHAQQILLKILKIFVS